jgi:hypothetical protein
MTSPCAGEAKADGGWGASACLSPHPWSAGSVGCPHPEPAPVQLPGPPPCDWQASPQAARMGAGGAGVEAAHLDHLLRRAEGHHHHTQLLGVHLEVGLVVGWWLPHCVEVPGVASAQPLVPGWVLLLMEAAQHLQHHCAEYQVQGLQLPGAGGAAVAGMAGRAERCGGRQQRGGSDQSQPPPVQPAYSAVQPVRGWRQTRWSPPVPLSPHPAGRTHQPQRQC